MGMDSGVDRGCSGEGGCNRPPDPTEEPQKWIPRFCFIIKNWVDKGYLKFSWDRN